MILLIDNYDSFTFNLYQLVETLGHRCEVRRNDALDLDFIRAAAPEAILISPGPGRPGEAGLTLEVIREFADEIPIIGICLGLQAIGEAFGAQVVRAPQPRHGKISPIFHQGRGSLRGMPNPFRAARYHSLVVERKSLPRELEVTCETADGLVMGLRHVSLPVEGVQFHPESVATAGGRQIVENFLHQALGAL